MLERRMDDYGNIEGYRDLSGSWTAFTRFITLDEQLPDGDTWSGWRLTKKQTTSRPDYLCPEIWKDMSEAAQPKEKQKWANEKPKLDNARRLRGIHFIDPADCGVQGNDVKIARRKLEVPMPAAMHCKIRGRKYKETCRTPDSRKTKYACIVEANESSRKRFEGLFIQIMMTHCRWRIQLIEPIQSHAQIYSYA